ncbi:MAG: M48 family metalloprotease, partial [Fimbriimonadaceae bacterium]|nr:M48 family metalloprotease [Fimbriimonadaceae bacterium]MCG9894287.1 M48 family metalloprotease [Fimbriimonadaceae bacterium]
ILQFSAIFFPSSSSEEGGMNPIAALGMAMIAPIAATVIQMAVSRAREYEADRLAADLVGSGRGLVSALQKLESGVARMPQTVPANRAHMYISNPLRGGGLMKLFSTHPATEDRVRRLMDHERRLAAR